jgi:hypothetical protein
VYKSVEKEYCTCNTYSRLKGKSSSFCIVGMQGNCIDVMDITVHVRRFLRATQYLGFISATMEATMDEAANFFLGSLSFHLEAFFHV